MIPIPEALKDAYNKIIASLIKPIVKWILKLSYVKRLLAVITIMIFVASIYYYKSIYGVVQYSALYYRILTTNGSAIPLSEKNQHLLKGLISNTTNTLLQSEFPKYKMEPGIYNAWTMADIVVSTECQDSTHCVQFQNYVYSSTSFSPRCQCWFQFQNSGFANYVATSWVMIGLDNSKKRVKDSLINYIVKTQNPDGWWSVYPSASLKDASTLSTAIVLLALKKCKSEIKDKNLRISVDESMNRGLKWLEGTFENNKKVIYDFPNAEDKNSSSVAIFGIVLHAIVSLESSANEVDSVKSAWLDNWDKNMKLVSINEGEKFDIKSTYKSGHAVDIGNNNALQDDINNYALPWFIIASIDSYDGASLVRKAKILSLCNKIIDQGDTLLNDAAGQPWLISEFLVGLRRMNRETVF